MTDFAALGRMASGTLLETLEVHFAVAAKVLGAGNGQVLFVAELAFLLLLLLLVAGKAVVMHRSHYP